MSNLQVMVGAFPATLVDKRMSHPDSTYRTLLALCRVHSTKAEANSLRARLSNQPVDWTEITRLAIRGGVAGLVHRNLAQLDVRRSTKLRLVQASLVTHATNHRMLESTRGLCAAAEAEGLTLIPLKGTALNLLGIYDDPGLRTQCDVDLLTSRDQILRMDRLLHQHGFEEDRIPHAYELRHSHHLRYVQEGAPTRLLLELHWTGLLDRYSRRDEERRILARCGMQVVQGVELRMLAPDDLVLLVMLHFCIHRYRGQLKWLVDVAELARQFEDVLDWSAIWARAQRIGALRAVSLAAELARNHLAAPIPHHGRLTLALGLLRQLAPIQSVVTSQPQPAWRHRLLINILQYDSPLHAALFLAGKGTEVLERERGIRLPVPRRDKLR